MPTLTPEQYSKFVRLTSLSAGKSSPEGQALAAAFKEDPVLEQEVTRLMQEFSTGTVGGDLKNALQKNIAAPGVVTTNIVSGASETLLDGAVFGIDLLRAITPDGSSVDKPLVETRAKLVAKRDQQETETAQAISDLMQGAEFNGLESLVAEDIPKFGGQVLPLLYMPSGLSTYWRTVGYNGLVGAGVVGATDKEAENLRDRLGGMTIGGAGTAVLAAGLHAPGGFRAFGARKIESQLQTELAKANLALEKEVQRITGVQDFSFTFGQVSANPFIVGLELGAAKTATRAHQNQQVQTLIDAFKVRANALSVQGNVDDIALDLNKTIREINKATDRKLSENFGTGLDNIIKRDAGQIVIDGKSYLRDAKKALERFTDPTQGGNAAPGFLVKQIAKIEDEIAQTGGLSVETTTNLLKSIRNIRGGGSGPIVPGASPSANKQLAGELERALLKSLDDVNTANPQAVADIQNLRKIYAFEKAEQAAINNKLLAGVFGVEDASAITAETAYRQLVGRSEGAQRATMGILDDINPGLADDIRAVRIRQIVDDAYVHQAPTSMNPHSVDRLASALGGGKAGEAAGMRGMFDARDALHFKRFGQALRTINETHLSAFPEASGTMVRDASINVVSRAPEFFARWMTGMLAQGSTVERMLIDPAFRESVIQIANKGLGTKASQSAMLYMVLTASGWRMSDAKDARAQARLERDALLEEGPRSEGM